MDHKQDEVFTCLSIPVSGSVSLPTYLGIQHNDIQVNTSSVVWKMHRGHVFMQEDKHLPVTWIYRILAAGDLEKLFSAILFT